MRTPKKKTFLNHVWQYFQSWSGSPASRCQTYQRIVLLGNDSIALRRSSCSVPLVMGTIPAGMIWMFSLGVSVPNRMDNGHPSSENHHIEYLLLNDYLNVDQDYTLFCFFCTKCILRNSRFSISYFHKVPAALKLCLFNSCQNVFKRCRQIF